MTQGANLPNLLKAHDYLHRQGWRVSKSTLYQHHKDGRIRILEDGTISTRDLDKYASTFLKQKDGRRTSEILDKLQEQRAQAETDIIRSKAIHWDVKTKIIKGEYVERTALESELATRAIIFKSDIENFFRGQAEAIIQMVSGDPQKAPDLIDFCLSQAEDWLDRYSGDHVFKVEPVTGKILEDSDDDADEKDEDDETE
jgi:hypothetical protein